MKNNPYELFTTSKESFALLQDIVAFATASIMDKELFAEIDKFTISYNKEKTNSSEYYFPHFPSIHSFVSFSFSKGKSGGDMPFILMEAAFGLLEDKLILTKNGTPSQLGDIYSQTYGLNEGWARYLQSNELLYSALLGFRYVIERYRQSVIKIEVFDAKGDASIGTGWLLDIILPSTTARPRFVITNAHVIENCRYFRLLDKDDRPIPHYGVEDFAHQEQVDMALIQVDYQAAIPDFCLANDTGMLAEVITMGYPAIPLSRAAYQVVHKGEVNALVKDYLTNQDLLIISARTAPGNSGSPVLDDMGRVVGMVTRELFEKEGFQERGIAPYSACLPAATIQAMLAKSSLIQNLPSPETPEKRTQDIHCE